jgi:hypothetical protein
VLQVLSYHIIPSAAVNKSQLNDCDAVPTALPGTKPLTVRVRHNKVDFEGATNDARVQHADIKAGSSVVHIVDDVLLPAKGDEKKKEAAVFARIDRALEAANLSTLAAAIEVRSRCGTVSNTVLPATTQRIADSLSLCVQMILQLHDFSSCYHNAAEK